MSNLFEKSIETNPSSCECASDEKILHYICSMTVLKSWKRSYRGLNRKCRSVVLKVSHSKLFKPLTIKSKVSFKTVPTATLLNSIFSVIQPIICPAFAQSNMQGFARNTTNNIKTSIFDNVFQGSTNRSVEFLKD